MKIIAISGSQVPSNVANSLQTMKAVHALAQLGHQVTLIVPSGVEETPEAHSWPDLAHLYGLQQEFEVEYLPSVSRRLFFLAAVRRARAFKPDVLYAWPLPSAVLGLMNGMAVVLEMHDLPSGRVGPLWFRYFRDSKGSKRLAVITRALREALTARYGSLTHHHNTEVVLASNGVELERFENLPDPAGARRALNLADGPTVVCTGHLYTGRGVELFLSLAEAFRRQGVHFLWAGGRQADIEMWQARARGLPNLSFCGFIANTQLPMYQAAGDLLLMPYSRQIGISSGPGHSAQISSPMKMFEYLATGRPIVASDLPVFREVLNERNAVFCAPDDPACWEKAVQDLLDHPEKRKALACQARQDAQQYSWIERARRIMNEFPQK